MDNGLLSGNSAASESLKKILFFSFDALLTPILGLWHTEQPILGLWHTEQPIHGPWHTEQPIHGLWHTEQPIHGPWHTEQHIIKCISQSLVYSTQNNTSSIPWSVTHRTTNPWSVAHRTTNPWSVAHRTTYHPFSVLWTDLIKNVL